MTPIAVMQLVTSLVEFSPGDRFFDSRKGGTRGGGWVLPKGENGVVQPWAGHRKPLLGAGWAASLVFCMNGRRKQPCHPLGPPFQAPVAIFCARTGWYCPSEYSLVSGRGQVCELTRDGWLFLCVQFGA